MNIRDDAEPDTSLTQFQQATVSLLDERHQYENREGH